MNNGRNRTVLKQADDYAVVAKNSDGCDVRAKLIRLTRYVAVLEVYDPDAVLRVSQALADFIITVQDATVYSGRGVVSSVINVGSMLVCEIKLADEGFQQGVPMLEGVESVAGSGFDDFLQQWQRVYRIEPDYKLVVGDMASLFSDLKYWLNQVELGFGRRNPFDKGSSDEEVIAPLARRVIPLIDGLFVRFEEAVEKLAPQARSFHASYMRQLLHPLVLCSPFAHRTFSKPLGYAGDYEMINMIARNGYEGPSLYAKVLNRWFIEQPPALAHRNRLTYLADRITDEAMRGMRERRQTRILNLACGPAWEVQGVFVQPELVPNTAFTLLDFNEETLRYTEGVLNRLQRQAPAMPRINYVKKSVHQLLVEASRRQESADVPKYDFVYCAGLFDYLSDQVCHRLLNLMFAWLAPGGLLVATNVEPSNPLKHGMDHLLEWHLTYRDAGEFRALAPQRARPDDVRVFSDTTGVNIFLEARKPHG